MKTARFQTVVAKAGRPQTYLQFVTLDKDQVLQEALKKGLVLSVNQTVVGQRKDFGWVGYDGSAVSQILVFPKSLGMFKDCRIVGLDYTLLDEPVAERPVKPKRGRKPEPEPEPVPEPKPKPRQNPLPIPVKLPSPAPLTGPQSDKSAKAGGSSPRPKAPPPKTQREPAPSLVATTATPKDNAPSVKDLKSKLAKVLLEWGKGHEVKANKMLVDIVAGL